MAFSRIQKIVTGVIGTAILFLLFILISNYIRGNDTENIVKNASSTQSITENSVDSLSITDGTIVDSDIAQNTLNASKLSVDLQRTIRSAANEATNNTTSITNLGLTVHDYGAIITHLTEQVQALLSSVGVATTTQTATRIAGSLIEDGTITADALASSLFSSFNTVTGSEIVDGTIHGSDIAAGAITSTLIGSGAVTSSKVASGSIGTLQLADGAVSTAKIANGGVGTSDISTGAITSDLLVDNAVTSSKILDGSIGNSDIASGAITNSLLGADAVTSDKISDGAIVTSDIALNSITSDLIVSNTIQSGDLALAAVGTSQITDNAITSALISDGTITASDIASGAITNGLLGMGAVTSDKIADGTIATADIASGSITNTLLGTGAVQTGNLSAAANKKTVSAPIGSVSVSLLGNDEWPVFIAPGNGTITRVTLTNKTSLSLSATASIRKNGTTTVASTALSALSTGMTPYTMTLGSGTSFVQGDVYSLYIDATVAVSLKNFLVTIDYVSAE